MRSQPIDNTAARFTVVRFVNCRVGRLKRAYPERAMRAAIVHYWLMNRRGGEKVLEALCGLLPDADIFTLFSDPAALGPVLEGRRIVTSYLNPLRRHYRSLLPLMPMA